LPEGVTLADGKIKPWDYAYILAQYKKNNFDLDEQKIAEYFPMEKTIRGLLGIYEKFMNITLKEVPVKGLWHDDVKMIEVYSNEPQSFRGYLILDLYPRDNKYNHAASFTIVSSIKDEQGTPSPAVDVVVTNFPKSTATRPSLLKHQDVETFFHEFGHAIHTILGGTTLASFSGTHVKTDFVEMPSQMLEEWMWDTNMLKQVSSHYTTAEPLPDEIIEKKIALKNLNSGNFILRQMFFAQLSLHYFKEGATKDTEAIEQSLHAALRPNILYEPEAYVQAAFGHLDGYGAKYYGYMWSKVFALDLFSLIREKGLLDNSIGQRYVNEILAQGGSQDPNVLLEKFLGRAPNQEAFLKSVGLN
jgi:thimet oligopeptidase